MVIEQFLTLLCVHAARVCSACPHLPIAWLMQLRSALMKPAEETCILKVAAWCEQISRAQRIPESASRRQGHPELS